MESAILAKDARLSQLYLSIISRYKDYIEEKEELAVAELPTLIAPKSESVARKTSELKATFPNYTYDRDFLVAALNAFNYV